MALSPFQTLYFIAPHVLERVVTGQFIAKRNKQGQYPLHQERRDVLSSLNVTRRAIRYEPLVFQNRRPLLIEGANAFNNPEKTIFMLPGPSGRGKTTFLRGLVEMMGGGKEQLLWFDVSRHTDFDEVVRFLIEYLTYACRSENSDPEKYTTQNPIALLDQLLKDAKDMPLLIVIDNVEFLVTPNQRIRSSELKDAFSFLLSFPNVKLVFSGRVLPLADFAASSDSVYVFDLPPLSPDESLETVKGWLHEDIDTAHLKPVVETLQGEPVFLSLFSHLYRQHATEDVWQNLLEELQSDCRQVLVDVLYEQLSAEEQDALGFLASFRHGLPTSLLNALWGEAKAPHSPHFKLTQLDHSAVKWVLKKVYPPQLVLHKLRTREELGQADKIEAYYQLAESYQEAILSRTPEDLLTQYHQVLHQFYTTEKAKHLLERSYPARTAHLQAEAQYHVSRIKNRRPFVAPVRFDVDEEDLPAGTPGTPLVDEEALSAFLNKVPAAEIDDTDPTPLPRPVSPVVVQEASSTPFTTDRTLPPIAIQVQAMSAPASGKSELSEHDLDRLAGILYERYLPKGRVTQTVTQSDTPSPPPETEPAELPVSLDAIDSEEHPLCDGVLEAAKARDTLTLSQKLLALGKLRLDHGQFENAEACLLQAIPYAKQAEAQDVLLQIHSVLGEAYYKHFLHNKALTAFKTVITLGEKTTLSDELAAFYTHALGRMADIAFYRGDTEEAIDFAERLLEQNPEDQAFQAENRFRLALAWDAANIPDKAIAAYLDALPFIETLGNPAALANCHFNLAQLYSESLDFKKALPHAQACVALDQQTHARESLFKSYLLLSEIATHLKQDPLAQGSAEAALDLAISTKNRPRAVEAHIVLGHLLAPLQPRQAIYHFKKALKLAHGRLNPRIAEDIRAKLATLS